MVGTREILKQQLNTLSVLVVCIKEKMRGWSERLKESEREAVQFKEHPH